MNPAHTPLRVTVSGSFRRHMRQIADDVEELTACGAVVLSPSEPRVVDSFGEFLFVASDIHRNVRRLQARHHEAIRRSAFLWVTCPDGNIGRSTAMEIGVASAHRVPVHAATPPNDLTFRQFVDCLSSPQDAVELHTQLNSVPMRSPLLLAPAAGADTLHRVAEQLQRHLEKPDLRHAESDPVIARIAALGRDALSGL